MQTTRRWRCPECGGILDLPIELDDPMICRECAADVRPAAEKSQRKPAQTHQPSNKRLSERWVWAFAAVFVVGGFIAFTDRTPEPEPQTDSGAYTPDFGRAPASHVPQPERDNSGNVGERNFAQVRPDDRLLERLPRDVKYTVRDTGKQRLHVELNRKVSKEVLRVVVAAVRRDEGLSRTTVVQCYITGDEKFLGAWAVVTFDPDLRIRFTRLTVEQESELRQVASRPDEKSVGHWLWDVVGSGHRITIYERGGSHFVREVFPNGGGGASRRISVVRTANGRRYIDNAERGEYCVINRDGDLEFYDAEGYIVKAIALQPTRKPSSDDAVEGKAVATERDTTWDLRTTQGVLTDATILGATRSVVTVHHAAGKTTVPLSAVPQELAQSVREAFKVRVPNPLTLSDGTALRDPVIECLEPDKVRIKHRGGLARYGYEQLASLGNSICPFSEKWRNRYAAFLATQKKKPVTKMSGTRTRRKGGKSKAASPPAQRSYGYGVNPFGGPTGRVWVRGYYRRDGTYVRGHWRSRPRR